MNEWLKRPGSATPGGTNVNQNLTNSTEKKKTRHKNCQNHVLY